MTRNIPDTEIKEKERFKKMKLTTAIKNIVPSIGRIIEEHKGRRTAVRREIYYLSADGKTNIHASIWEPSCEPKAVVQIFHGMIEHIGRYSDFAEFLASKGYVVAGEDHLGHGESVVDGTYYGYFGKDGNSNIIADNHALRLKLEAEYPNLPVIMLGHSMGSFLVRQYVTEKSSEYAQGLAGAIFMGTGWQPRIAIAGGKALAKVIGFFKGDKSTSKFIDKIVMGPYFKRIENPKTVSDWLSRSEESVIAYRTDPYCRFHFTTNAYYNMFKSVGISQKISRIKTLPEGFPILLISGAEDPVGNYGEGVRKAFMAYKENTKCQMDIKLYDDDRHEVLNELNKEEVYSDLLEWLDCLVEDRK